MIDRVRSAIDARANHGFVIMVRTHRFAAGGAQAAIERALSYAEAGQHHLCRGET
jgi:methylisocitrate lyase